MSEEEDAQDNQASLGPAKQDGLHPAPCMLQERQLANLHHMEYKVSEWCVSSTVYVVALSALCTSKQNAFVVPKSGIPERSNSLVQE